MTSRAVRHTGPMAPKETLAFTVGDRVGWVEHPDSDRLCTRTPGEGWVSNIMRDPSDWSRQDHVMIALDNGRITFVPPWAVAVSAGTDGQARMAI